MGEQLNDDLREQGSAVWETKLHSVQGCPFEVTLHKKKKKHYHFMWVSLHMHSSVCRTVYPFILAHFF